MTDQSRQNQPDHSQESLRGRNDQSGHEFESGSDTRSRRDTSDTAEDRGLDRERRNIGGPREADRTRNPDDEEEGLGGFGRSER